MNFLHITVSSFFRVTNNKSTYMHAWGGGGTERSWCKFWGN